MTQFRDRATGLASTLALLLAVAAVLRILWWAGFVGVIENEGVEYTRLAWNLFHGRGYVSIFGGTHTLFPPLYPILIGLVTPLAGTEEVAARTVSFVAGLATVAAVFLLALEIFGKRVAALAGLTAACHPLLVALSVTAYSEGTYVALATLCALAAVRCVRDPSALRASAVGVFAGLAYLTRPEGIALAIPLAGIVLLASVAGARRRSPSALVPAALVLAAAGLVALPYVVHLSRIAGGFRWEGKSPVNNRITVRQEQGLSYREAGYGLGPDGEPLGPFLFADQHALLAKPTGESGGLVRSLTEAPLERLRYLSGRLANARYLGAPPILVLALLGLVATPWWRTRFLAGAALLVPPAITVLVLLTLRFAWSRYLFPLLPVLVVWAAAGADVAGRATAGTLARLGAGERSRRLAGALACALLLISALVFAERSVPRVEELAQTRKLGAREAGARLAADYESSGGDGRPRIASIGLALAHYSGGEVMYLPYAEESLALRFLRRAAPDYVALRRTESTMAPYAEKWLASGLPDECARELADLPQAASASYRIWRWACAATAPADGAPATSRLRPPPGSGAAPLRAAASSPGR
jgi:4-amino-4-deoxy-L-arabinose transferase-like glycosyltransferase